MSVCSSHNALFSSTQCSVVSLSDYQRLQATLPFKAGGMGIHLGSEILVANKKISNYNPLTTQYYFVLLAFETLSPINNAMPTSITKIGHSLMHVFRDARETCHLLECLPVAIQYYFAVALRSTFFLPALDEV